MSTSLHLSDSELSNALAYLETEGYAHYFPDPFELKALRHCWDKALQVLTGIDLLNYNPKPAFDVLAPKQKFAVRPVRVPDPIDMLLFSGVGLRLAPAIEAARIPRAEHKILSFRYEQDPSGLPRFASDWDEWTQAIGSRVGTHPYIVKADIVDFFPRIYLHRLENALAATGSDLDVRALFRFLQTWSNGTSYGIPVGPKICSILAEGLLTEVDQYLESHGLDFIRYVDDFVFFGESSTDCLHALYLLAERLEETQGLSLNMAKTKVMKTEELAGQLVDPKDANVAFRKNIIENVFGGDPYVEIDADSLDDEQKSLLDSMNATELLEKALEGDLVDLPTVNFVLNMLASLQRPENIEIVLNNLERLLPVSHSVARFISVFNAVDPAHRLQIGRKILSHIRTSKFIPDYQSIWLLQPFTETPNWGGISDLRAIARDHKNRMVRRQAVLSLGQLGDRSALLDLKSHETDARDWEWRAIIYACRGLPKDEREAFWNNLRRFMTWDVSRFTDRISLEFIRSVA